MINLLLALPCPPGTGDPLAAFVIAAPVTVVFTSLVAWVAARRSRRLQSKVVRFHR